MSEQTHFMVSVLDIFSKGDLRDDLIYTVKESTVYFYVDCSDVFFWATADTEPLRPEDLPLLQQTYEDLWRFPVYPHTGADGSIEMGSRFHLGALYCARKRRMRPQKPYYKYCTSEIAALFDAAGPERDY